MVENANPSLEMQPKMHPLRLKLVLRSTENATPPSETRKGMTFAGAENRTPQPEITSNMQPLKQKCNVDMPNMRRLKQTLRRTCNPLAENADPVEPLDGIPGI